MSRFWRGEDFESFKWNERRHDELSMEGMDKRYDEQERAKWTCVNCGSEDVWWIESEYPAYKRCSDCGEEWDDE